MIDPNSWIEVFGEVKRETKLAILFDDGTVSAWLPKSQIEWDGEKDKYGCATIGVREVVAKDKGLI